MPTGVQARARQPSLAARRSRASRSAYRLRHLRPRHPSVRAAECAGHVARLRGAGGCRRRLGSRLRAPEHRAHARSRRRVEQVIASLLELACANLERLGELESEGGEVVNDGAHGDDAVGLGLGLCIVASRGGQKSVGGTEHGGRPHAGLAARRGTVGVEHHPRRSRSRQLVLTHAVSLPSSSDDAYVRRSRPALLTVARLGAGVAWNPSRGLASPGYLRRVAALSIGARLLRPLTGR